MTELTDRTGATGAPEPSAGTTRTRRKDDGRLGWGLRIWVAMVMGLLILPTVVVIPMSFTGARTFQFPPEDWSLRWYREFFTSASWTSAFTTSLRVALVVAVLASVLGIAAAIALNRWTLPGKELVRQLLLAPLIIPSVVIAIALYYVFLDWQLTGSFEGFVLAHTVIALPFVIVSVTTSLNTYDRQLSLASASLGAGAVTTFLRVTVPLIMPGIASGFVFAFVTSLDEVVIALFLQSPSFETLPVRMYEGVTSDIDPTVAVASTVMVVATLIALLIPEVLRLRRPKS
jgi:putative spermidine/putrescine transport system permease protein